MTNTIYLVLLLLSLTLTSCGGGEHSTTDTGSASFGLTFEEATAPAAMKLAPSMAPADICSSYGIDSISGTVYNSSNTAIATGGPWACSAHQGTIYNIPSGSNIRIKIEGTVSGSVVWQGETTGNTIYAGQDTNVGSIPMTYTGTDTTRPTVTTVTPTGTNVSLTSPITVTFSEAMASSTIDSTTFTLKNGSVAVPGSVSYNSTTKTATFTPTSSLSNSVIYTATVTTDVTDMAANKMQSLYTWDFTTKAVVIVHVPDTGQTGDYTTTFGEDSDYTINPPSYTDNGNGTITDNITGLLWQKQDDATTRTWTDAGTYCTNLSLAGTGWRLPTDVELMTIVDYGKYNPYINTTYFPQTQSSNYWSSTTSAYSTSSAWGVNFGSGNALSVVKTDSNCARCVLGGQ